MKMTKGGRMTREKEVYCNILINYVNHLWTLGMLEGDQWGLEERKANLIGKDHNKVRTSNLP